MLSCGTRTLPSTMHSMGDVTLSVRCRHHCGVTSPPRRHHEGRGCRARRRGADSRARTEGTDPPRARGRGRESASLHSLAKAGSESSPLILQNRVKAAYICRWSGILACAAARSLALSLLERRLILGTGADAPSVQEVLRDDRFA